MHRMLAFAFSLSNQPFEIGLLTFPFIVKLLFSDFTLLVLFNGHKENQILVLEYLRQETAPCLEEIRQD